MKKAGYLMMNSEKHCTEIAHTADAMPRKDALKKAKELYINITGQTIEKLETKTQKGRKHLNRLNI